MVATFSLSHIVFGKHNRHEFGVEVNVNSFQVITTRSFFLEKITHRKNVFTTLIAQNSA